jgi:hypothetical protein
MPFPHQNVSALVREQGQALKRVGVCQHGPPVVTQASVAVCGQLPEQPTQPHTCQLYTCCWKTGLDTCHARAIQRLERLTAWVQGDLFYTQG